MIRPISFEAVRHLARHMREADRLEVFNTLDHDDPDRLAREICLVTAFGRTGVSFIDGMPVGLIGVSPIRSGVWSAWSFGTDDWHRGAFDLTRFAFRHLMPWLLARGAHRLQCESRFDHVEAHRWLERCGAQREGILRGFGRDGSDYIQYSWTRENAHVCFRKDAAAQEVTGAA